MISGILFSDSVPSHGGITATPARGEEDLFFRHIVNVFRSTRVIDIVIVLKSEQMKIANDLSWFDGKIVFNPSMQTGDLSSIRAGFDTVSQDDFHGVMICPVNHPLISQKLLVNLLQSFWHSKKNIIIPVYNGSRGYPIIIGTKLLETVWNSPQDGGLKDMIEKHQSEIHDVQTDEKGAILTISTMEEYNKYSGVMNNA